MRDNYKLFRVSNGWVLLPENFNYFGSGPMEQYMIFRDLKSFTEWVVPPNVISRPEPRKKK